MKIKNNFILQNVLDKNVLINTDGSFHGIVELNDTSYEICKGLSLGLDIDEIAKALTESFDVDKESAKESVKNFCDDMIQKGFFEG